MANEVWFKPKKHQNECHIIGSGWSLNKTHHLARQENAYIVGFNHAALMDLPYNAYFNEFAGPGLEALAEQQRALLDERVIPHTSNIYFKGLTLKRTNVSYAVDLFGDVSAFTMDRMPLYYTPRRLHSAVNFLLKRDKTYIRQYQSTAISMIALAYLSGFKKIKLHGVDFGRAYFYDDEKFDIPERLRPPSNLGYYKKTNNETGSHSTNPVGVGVSSILPILKEKLATQNVELTAASSESPSAKIIGY